MGKYMKKGKLISGQVSVVMEIQQQQQQQSASVTLGVRTRARTLALQPNPDVSYLQLRSRRLEKQLQPTPTPIHGASRQRADSVSNESVTRESRKGHFDSDQASFADNHLEFDSTERGTRESTPCSLIRNAEAIVTPGSSTRRTCSASANRRPRDMQRTIPTTLEMEEFFAGFELHQQELFLQKYNYDIANDMPLPGRYDWVRVDN